MVTLAAGTLCSVSCGERDGTTGAVVSSEQTVEVQAASPFLGALAGEERARPLAAAQDATVRKVSLAAPLPAHGLGIVGGVYQEDGIVGRYTWVVEPELGVGGASSATPKQAGVAALPRPKIAPEVADAAKLGLPVPVIINLKQDFGTSLRDVSFERFTSFDAGQVNTSAERKARIVAREAEAAELQKPVSSALADLGIPSSGFWLVNALAATVPPALVPEIAKLAAVRSIDLDAQLTKTESDRWDGDNVKAASGLSAGHYGNNGYDGERYNPVTGQHLSIALLDFDFNANHPVFLDWGGGPTRVRHQIKCGSMVCLWWDFGWGAGDLHGSLCASAAAGDAMDNQILGIEQFRRDRTGAAEEADLMFIGTGAISATIRGLATAVSFEADVVSESFGGADSTCDGFYSGWENAVYNAHQAGVLTVGSAGNNNEAARTGNCKLTGLSEVPSQLVVGGLNDPRLGTYSAVDIWPNTSRGGVNVTINGQSYSEAFTGVDVLVPNEWWWGAYTDATFTHTGGTSLAAPQVAGTALLLKDWFIGNGFASHVAVPGFLFANVLAMTDRAYTSTLYKTSRFDPLWGGGRFQERYYALPDHPSGLYRLEWAVVTIANGQHVWHRVGGVGNEPSGIEVLKAYAVFFEADGANVADIDIELFDKGCGSGRASLGFDNSRDSKSLVKTGTAAAGKDVCVDLYGYFVPAGETRQVVLVVYYSDQTSMR